MLLSGAPGYPVAAPDMYVHSYVHISASVPSTSPTVRIWGGSGICIMPPFLRHMAVKNLDAATDRPTRRCYEAWTEEEYPSQSQRSWCVGVTLEQSYGHSSCVMHRLHNMRWGEAENSMLSNSCRSKDDKKHIQV